MIYKNICNDIGLKVKLWEDNKFMDLYSDEIGLFITDYSNLNREIVVDIDSVDTFLLKIGAVKERKEIKTIAELQRVFFIFILLANRVLFGNKSNLSDLMKQLLNEQLVFDVLFYKYCETSEHMTRRSYAKYMSELLYDDKVQRVNAISSINENIRRAEKKFYENIHGFDFKEQFQKLGVNFNKLEEYLNPNIKKNYKKKKSKLLWDNYFYNFGRNKVEEDSDNNNSKSNRDPITVKQYKRQLTKDGRNYSYEEIIDDLRKYNNFIYRLLPVENESFKKYFNKSMDYYCLEVYKRIDFMFKLIPLLLNKRIVDIDRQFFLLKRFHPQVLVPVVNENDLGFGYIYKYYRPMFMIEDELRKQMEECTDFDYSVYKQELQTCQLIRAKAYEIFKYHFIYVPEDYKEIKKFLCKCYDMRKYHESNFIWQMIKDKKWSDFDKETQDILKTIIKHFFQINNEGFFWKNYEEEFVLNKVTIY